MDREELLREIYNNIIKMLNEAYQPNPFDMWKATMSHHSDNDLRKILAKVRDITK